MPAALVTGVAGLVGAEVARGLVRDDRDVVGLDLVEPPEDLLRQPRFSFVSGDATDYAVVLDATRQFDVSKIVHAALPAASYPARSVRSLRQTISTTIDSTLAVLEAARLVGLGRVVYLSSVDVYCPAIERDMIDEDSPTEGCHPYGAGKRAAELVGLQYARWAAVDFVALRPTGIFGPRRRAPGEFVTWLVDSALAGRPIRLGRGADGYVQAIYVQDCAEATIRALDASLGDHRIFNVGSGTAYRVRDIVEAVRAVVPKAEIEVGSGPPGPELAQFWVASRLAGVFSIERIVRELGWRPRYTLAAALEEHVRHLRDRERGVRQ